MILEGKEKYLQKIDLDVQIPPPLSRRIGEYSISYWINTMCLEFPHLSWMVISSLTVLKRQSFSITIWRNSSFSKWKHRASSGLLYQKNLFFDIKSEEVYKILKLFKTKNAHGPDGLLFIKEIYQPLRFILQTILEADKFRDQWKGKCNT